jgi:hypothetical protein
VTGHTIRLTAGLNKNGIILLYTHPETIVQKAVDDWVDETIRHRKPMNAVEDADKKSLLAHCLVGG